MIMKYILIFYLKIACIDELSLDFSIIDLGSCYKKIQLYYDTTEELIISIMNVKNNNKNKPVTLYEVFEPKLGKKVDIEKICGNQSIVIKESIFKYLSSSKNLITEQNIDIFNLSGSFYTDICYHFDSPNGKDVPLKDRIISFYPNISYCDVGCIYKGFDLETVKTECECKLNNFFDNYLFVNDILLSDSLIGEAMSLIKESNIQVLKCYKDLKYLKYYKSKGSIIILLLISTQTICSMLFLYRNLFDLKKYIYNLMENFIIYISHKKNDVIDNPTKKNKKLSIMLKKQESSSKRRLKKKYDINNSTINSLSKKVNNKKKILLKPQSTVNLKKMSNSKNKYYKI